MNFIGNDNLNISLIKDPFNKTSIKEINFFGRTNFLKGVWEWSCNLEFKNGDTEGRQRFKQEGLENFNILLKQVQDFINSLK